MRKAFTFHYVFCYVLYCAMHLCVKIYLYFGLCCEDVTPPLLFSILLLSPSIYDVLAGQQIFCRVTVVLLLQLTAGPPHSKAGSSFPERER